MSADHGQPIFDAAKINAQIFSIETGLNQAYNQAIDHAADILWANRFVYTGIADMVEKLQALKKPSQPLENQ